jgi:tetratricopeptide (TPR) repeat protein
MQLAFKVVAVLILLEGTLALPVSAGPAEDLARDRTKKANAAFNLGSYDEAATEYEAAYRTVPDPALLFNIGQSYRLGGKPDKALIAYKSYLRTAPANASNRAQVEARLRELEAESALKDEMAGVATTPTQPVQATSSVPPNPQTKPSTREELSTPSGEGVSSPRGIWLGRTWTWVAGGSAVLFAGAAAIFGLAMRSKYDELNGKCGSASKTFPGCTTSDFSSLDTRRNTANLFWGLSAAATLTAGVLFYLEGRPVYVAPMAGVATGLLAQVRY